MSSTFAELCLQYDGAEKIPHEDLYACLVYFREDLVNEAKLGIDRLPTSKLGIEVRRRCKTDLFWLARYFTWMTNPFSDGGTKDLSENLIDEEYYKVVCDFFIKKDDTKRIQDQSEVKTHMILWPRGGMKSSIDHIDSCQWALNFPEIRILYLTAEASLAKGFVGEIKGHFYIKPEEPTWMNLFWPEMCIDEKKAGAANVFVCPVYAAKKTGRKEPTVIGSSVGKNKAGWRYELIKADDAVSDVNSESSEQCETVSNKLYLAEKLLALGGFYIDYIGTRYADEDHYGKMLEQNVGDIVRTEGPGWEMTENKTTGINILVGRAITIKPEVVQKLEKEGRPVTYKEAGPEGCILLLPRVMSFKWCMEDLAKDEKSFEGQRNQNPRPRSHITFDKTLLLKCTVPYQQMPQYGAVTQVWDFAFSKKKGRDYSCGCSIMWAEEDEYTVVNDERKKTGNKITVGYVQEIVRDRFNHITLAQAVVNLAEKYRPFVVGVEDVGGSRFLTEQIRAEALRKKNPQVAQVCSSIDWFAPDNQKDAKKVRMASLYPLFVEGRLKMASWCMDPHPMDLLYTEFEKCLTSHHHDDIPDVISMQTRYMPRATVAIIENNEAMMTRSDPLWNIIYENGDQFGRAGYGMPEPVMQFTEDMQFQEEYVEAETPQGLNNVLGAGIFG